MTPRVSIIMPCYNAAAHLARSVGSVLAQTRGDWELVIVDDGSSDSSWQELQRLSESDPRIRVFHQPNAGAAAARNRALQEARGVYTAFLDADDTWHPEFLEAMVAVLDHDPSAGIAYCGWQNLGLGERRDDPFVPPDYENRGKTESLLGGCRWPIHAALVRTQAILDSGCFDESLSSCMDYDLWLRLGTIHRLARLPRAQAYYHHHGGEQITRNRARIALNHLAIVLGKPTFVLLGPSSGRKVFPAFLKNAFIISKQFECQPCQEKPELRVWRLRTAQSFCPRHIRCTNEISVSEVMSAITLQLPHIEVHSAYRGKIVNGAQIKWQA